MNQAAMNGTTATRPRRLKAQGATLRREVFRTSRLLDFLSEKELVAQVGHPVSAWPLVIVKELVDNALDACEEAGNPPDVRIKVDPEGIEVADNGPGLPAKTIEDVLDFSCRVSSREAYVSPTRGAQGNALKTLVAIPYVLNGERGHVEITAKGIRHNITLNTDRIRQQPVVSHNQEAIGPSAGTSFRIHWPNSPGSNVGEDDHETPQILQVGQKPTDVCGLVLDEDGGWRLQGSNAGETDSPRSILTNAKHRFLQVASDYAFLNPHLTLEIDWHGEIQRFDAIDPAWKNWKPSMPTSAHWYDLERFTRLVAAYISADKDNGRDRTVRELVSEFNGLSATAKQKSVCDACKLGRTNLSELVKGGDLNRKVLGKLLAAMKANSKAVKPRALGVIGRERIAKRFESLGAEMDSFAYKAILSTKDGIPAVYETAFTWCPKIGNHRRFVTGVNWSPGILNPFRELGKYGQSLDAVLVNQRCGHDEPLLLLLHAACPRVTYCDRGKSAVVTE